jgi:hypothetical protein
MRTLLILLTLGCAGFSAAVGQWHVALEVATMRYRGGAHDTSGQNVDARPDGGGMLSLRIARHWSHWGTALRVSYANTGFRLGAQGLDIVYRSTGHLFEISPVVSTRVGGIGPSGAVWMEVGPALHLWDFDGEYRKRIGATAALLYEWPVVRKLTGAIRLEGMLSPSWFDAADVPPEFERHATWRYGVGLGLRYRISGG